MCTCSIHSVGGSNGSHVHLLLSNLHIRVDILGQEGQELVSVVRVELLQQGQSAHHKAGQIQVIRELTRQQLT